MFSLQLSCVAVTWSFGVRYLVSQRKKKRSEPYSTGEVNSLIDSLIHPLYKKSEGYRVLDGLARAWSP